MRVFNQHKLQISKPAAEVGKLLDSLASERDQLWPLENWPKIYFDRPLQVGAHGGHSPIQYEITNYIPQEFIQFKFIAPAGFVGIHYFKIETLDANRCEISHTIEMNVTGKGIITWHIAILYLHNALIRDLFAKAEASLGIEPTNHPWNPWVKVLRWCLSGGRGKPQQPAVLGAN